MFFPKCRPFPNQSKIAIRAEAGVLFALWFKYEAITELSAGGEEELFYKEKKDSYDGIAKSSPEVERGGVYPTALNKSLSAFAYEPILDFCSASEPTDASFSTLIGDAAA